MIRIRCPPVPQFLQTPSSSAQASWPENVCLCGMAWPEIKFHTSSLMRFSSLSSSFLKQVPGMHGIRALMLDLFIATPLSCCTCPAVEVGDHKEETNSQSLGRDSANFHAIPIGLHLGFPSWGLEKKGALHSTWKASVSCICAFAIIQIINRSDVSAVLHKKEQTVRKAILVLKEPPTTTKGCIQTNIWELYGVFSLACWCHDKQQCRVQHDAHLHGWQPWQSSARNTA